MAITQVANPSSVPSAVADYEAQNAHISAFNTICNNQPFILTNAKSTGLPAIVKGSYIHFGANLYIVDTNDYIIQGTPVDGNNYIRINGTTTLTATWVQDISSYEWNPVYQYKYIGTDIYNVTHALLPYLVVKDGTEYTKYTLFNNDVAFNGTIIDKNGREVLSLKTEIQTATFTPSSGSFATGTLTFSSDILGIADITVGSKEGEPYTSNSRIVDVFSYTITGDTLSYNVASAEGIPKRITCTAFI